MRQVAQRAGVAMVTVSRAFSDPGKLSPATLKRIEDAGAALNYTINSNAQSLRRRASRVVLVLLPDIGNPFFSQLLKGMEASARRHGRAILIGDTGAGGSLADNYAAQLHARTAEALILLDGKLPFAFDRAARATLLRLPVVAVSERITDAAIPFVGIDNVRAAEEVATLIGAAGHRRVAHIRGPSGNILSDERARGFTKGATTAGMTILGAPEGTFSIRSGLDAASAILAWPERPTAVFAANDEMAMGAIHGFKAAGLTVPDDISVVGFDDIAFSEIFEPPLTTVRQPRQAMGRTAIDLVASWDEAGPGGRRTTILDYQIIERKSLGAPPGVLSLNQSTEDRCQPR